MLNPEPDACYSPKKYKIRNNAESDAGRTLNLTLVTNLSCIHTKWETTLNKTLNPEPDARYNPYKYKIRNNTDSDAGPWTWYLLQPYYV